MSTIAEIQQQCEYKMKRTIESLRPTIALKSEDFPTFGRPTIAMEGIRTLSFEIGSAIGNAPLLTDCGTN